MVKYKDIFNSNIEFDEIPEHCETENGLHHVLTEDYLNIQIDNAVLIYIAGYAAHKICSKQQCQQCKTILRENKGCAINDEYFDYLQQGGLSVPIDIVLNICKHVIVLMSCLVSEKYEMKFLQQISQKAVLKILTRKSITGDQFLNEFLEETCDCGKKYQEFADDVINITCNILLNNYSKQKNDIIARKKSNYEKGNKCKIVRKYQN